MGLPSHQRMRRTAEFQAVRAQGKVFRCGSFIFNYWAQAENNPAAARRFGIVASRRVGNAVARNRAKRIFRELIRKHQEKLPKRGDFVLIARSYYANKTFAELEANFLKACKEASNSKAS